MQARELMTTDVVAVHQETPVREIARLLLERHVSAAPVIDAAGAVVGMVSEGDLIGRGEPEREARRDWWLELLAEGEALSPDFLKGLRQPERTARDVMSAPIISVGERQEASEIAALLSQYRIKRVPVVRKGRLVGIVSRADLLRAIAAGEPHPSSERVARASGLLREALASLDTRFFGHRESPAGAPPDHLAPGAAPGEAPGQAIAEGGLSVGDFQALVRGAEQHKIELDAAARRAAADERSAKVRELIEEHVRDDNWKALLHQARAVAQAGGREFALLRFPSESCSDGGRAINAALPDWPQTLRGEAAEMYARWDSELKPRGFHLKARILDFPRGMPGDVGLFLGWGE
jgi:CBS domain-containing protein